MDKGNVPYIWNRMVYPNYVNSRLVAGICFTTIAFVSGNPKIVMVLLVPFVVLEHPITSSSGSGTSE